MSIIKFTVRNEGKSNAVGLVRLKQEHFELVKQFMHSSENYVRFPADIILVKQGSGFYQFQAPVWDENPTEKIQRAIRLTSKAIYSSKSFQKKEPRVKNTKLNLADRLSQKYRVICK